MKIFAAIFLLTTAVLVYAIWIEPSWIQVRQVKIVDPVLAEAWGKIRLMHLSDLHIRKINRREKQLLQLVKELHPDLIAVTGDLTQWGANSSKAVSLVKRLQAPLGVYGVLGDSDLSDNRRHCLFCHPGGDIHQQRNQPRILQDEVIHVSLPHGKMILAGLTPDEQQEKLPSLEFTDDERQEPVLFLSHFSRPFCRDWSDRPALCLSGDTHGGQIRLPAFFWKLISPKSDPEHMAGLYKTGVSSWLYVNRGLGTTTRFPLRLGVRPEVTLITFHKPGEIKNHRGKKQK